MTWPCDCNKARSSGVIRAAVRSSRLIRSIHHSFSSIAKLRPYVTLLPQPSPVNLNTASKEVIAAVIPGLNLAIADRLVQTRQRQPFKQLGDVQTLLATPGQTLDSQRVDVRSRYFEVRGKLRLDDRIVEERSLVERSSSEVIALRRERIASVESAGGKP